MGRRKREGERKRETWLGKGRLGKGEVNGEGKKEERKGIRRERKK
jgi:hypothetical protein